MIVAAELHRVNRDKNRPDQPAATKPVATDWLDISSKEGDEHAVVTTMLFFSKRRGQAILKADGKEGNKQLEETGGYDSDPGLLSERAESASFDDELIAPSKEAKNH